MSRSSKFILEQTNDLAAKFYSCWGYKVKEGFKFYESNHGHEQIAWKQACIAQSVLTFTCINDVFSDLDIEI